MWERRLPLSTGEVTPASPCEGTGGGQCGMKKTDAMGDLRSCKEALEYANY